MAEITDKVVAAASADVPDAISNGLNSLLIGALEIDPSDDNAKSQAKELLELASSLEALTSAKPIYKIDSETGEPITKYDPLSNTYVKVKDESNEAFYQVAQDRQDQLQADYVGLTLQQWRDIDNEPNPSQIKSDRINAVKIGVTYAEYLNFANLDPTSPDDWSIYPFVGYEDDVFLLVISLSFNLAMLVDL